MKQQSDQVDKKEIVWTNFLKILQNYGIKLSVEQRQTILDACPGRGDNELKINVGQLYEVRYIDKLRTVYKKVHINDAVDEDIAVDASGYTGNFLRKFTDK